MARIGDRDEEIISERCTWDYMTTDDFDKVKTDVIQGVSSLAFVDYVTYRHAVFASVEVILVTGRNDETCNHAHVYGSIIANYGDGYSTVLFYKNQNDSVVVEYGTCIELSRQVVAVPAWSSFTIHADLWNAKTNQKIVGKTDKQSDETRVLHDVADNIEIEGQNDVIEVRLEWGHADLQQPHEAASEEESIIFLPASEYDVIPDQQTRVALNNRNSSSWLSQVSFWDSYFELWEVFSISVYSDSDEELNLWGSIDATTVSFPRSLYTLFKRTSPQRLLPNQTIPIEYPTICIKSPAFMTLNLVGDDGRVISKGEICWDQTTLDNCTSCLNRLMCSVVPGDDGYYATVHYTIFPNAFRALVKICLIDKTCSLKDTKVDGCIRAQYSEFTYVTPNEKESYRRKLFEGRLEDPSVQFSDSKIQLSESVIAVGDGFTLIVDMNLVVISDDDKVENDEMVKTGETFKQQLQFSPDIGSKEIFLDRTYHQIVVFVEWSNQLLLTHV